MDKKDPRASLLEQLMNNTLGVNDTFKFKCKECGKCCRNRDDILLSPFDIYRISKYLNLKPKEVFEKYCETYIGDTSLVPVVRLKFKTDFGPLVLIKPQNNGTVCPLLSNGKCSVHKAKPVVCALFPLGRFWDHKSKKIKYALQNVPCGDKTESHSVKEWLADFDISESDKSLTIWSDFISHAREVIQKLSDKIKELTWNAFFLIIYLSYDISQEFMPQFEKNIKEFKQILQFAESTLP